MKTISQSSSITPAITPAILLLIVLAAAITFIGVSGKKVPLLTNIRLDIILLVVLGMTICTMGGIGRVASTNAWTHPLSILGYVLGILILLITISVFANWKLPVIQTDQQALLAIAILIGFKVINSILHSLLVHL